MNGLIDQIESEIDPDQIKIARIRIGVDGKVTYKRGPWGLFITILFDREMLELREVNSWIDLIKTEYKITQNSAIVMAENTLVVLAE